MPLPDNFDIYRDDIRQLNEEQIDALIIKLRQELDHKNKRINRLSRLEFPDTTGQ